MAAHAFWSVFLFQPTAKPIRLQLNLVDLRRCEVFHSKLEKLRKMQKRKGRFVFVHMICAMEDSRKNMDNQKMAIVDYVIHGWSLTMWLIFVINSF